MSENWLGEMMARLSAVMARRRVIPRVPEGRSVQLPANDTDETADPDAPTEEPAPRGLFIVYRAADGAVSQRTITVRQLIGNPPELMLAWCHLRRRARHFRFDRIVEAVDPESGELLSLETLAVQLQGDHRPLDRRLRQIVNLLVFIARCDGSVVKPEWSAIDDALARYLVRFGGDDEVHKQVCTMARQVAPSGDDVLIAMRSFAASPDRRALADWLTQALQAVLDADGTHARAEFDWILIITDFVNTMRH